MTTQASLPKPSGAQADKVSPSIRKVRSLGRGLDILRLLNDHHPSTLTQLVDASGLSRGTVYRVLVTLVGLGFVKRRDPSGTYMLTPRVMALSNGFDEENWPADVAKSHMVALGERLDWPVVLATLFGTSMIIRENTDSLTSMVFNVIKPGYRMPVFASASGWTYLAYCEEKERETLLSTIDSAADNPWRDLTLSPVDLEFVLSRIRGDGFCILPQPSARSNVLSVPVFKENDRFLAALSVRYFANSMSSTQAREQFVKPMADCAADISKDYEMWMHGHAQ